MGRMSSKPALDLGVRRILMRGRSVQSVRSYKTCGQAVLAAAKETTAVAASAASTSLVVVKELYKATSSVLPLFQASTMPRYVLSCSSRISLIIALQTAR